MKVALTGSTGFLGQHLVARFLSQGHEVVAIVRAHEAPPDPRVNVIKGDLDEVSALEQLARSDVVVHLAGVSPRRPGPV